MAPLCLPCRSRDNAVAEAHTRAAVQPRLGEIRRPRGAEAPRGARRHRLPASRWSEATRASHSIFAERKSELRISAQTREAPLLSGAAAGEQEDGEPPKPAA